MKITKVRCHKVIVPLHADRATSAEYGPAGFDEKAKIILEAETDEQIVGLGETPRGVSGDQLRSMLQPLAGVDLTELTIQEPVLMDLSRHDFFAHEHPSRPNRKLEQSFASYSHQGVHAALLDLLGKRTGLPAYMFLGGAYRNRVRVDYWMGRMTSEDSARVCREAQQHGYRGVKCKCALEDDNVERAEAVRDACGLDFKMTFDPNCRFYRPGEAMPMLKSLAAVGNIGCVEDPFHKSNFEWYRLLRSQALFPVALHMGYSPQLIEAIRVEACDYLNITALPWDAQKGGAIAWAAGIPSWHGSGVDLGITEALILHTCAATKSMSLPSDVLSRSIREHNLITNDLAVHEGTVEVPTGPGLGVELDRDALERYRVDEFVIDMA